MSQPVVTASGNLPWVSGLAANGRVVASAAKVPQVHDSPLVAWQPAVGATTYEVEISHKSYPWRTTWSTQHGGDLGRPPARQSRTSGPGTTACAA